MGFSMEAQKKFQVQNKCAHSIFSSRYSIYIPPNYLYFLKANDTFFFPQVGLFSKQKISGFYLLQLIWEEIKKKNYAELDSI